MGVFAITTISSIFAYVWLFLVLKVISPDEVEMWEAWVTLGFFFILLICAYTADRINAKKIKEKEQQEEEANRLKGEKGGDELEKVLKYELLDFYQVLIAE